MPTELLAPAGNFEIAKMALYEGADALYLATERFGARAYAKNLNLEELQEIINIANSLNKKIYVTVNTIIKDSELPQVYEYLNTLYKLGVHAVIATDLAVINYIIKALPQMECHISTQVGVKNLDDVRFFEHFGAKRTVLARETSLEEIKKIKQSTTMPIEVFIHGALCVSYSGNCYMSSLMTLRSGNRGRCAQNCRYEYEILRDNQVIAPKANYLAMKDLNSFNNVYELKELQVDSLKIEGRMKDIDYVRNVIRSYRHKLDNKDYQTDVLDKIFHREYTKGFLMDEDNGKVVNSLRSGSVGQFVGKIKHLGNKTYKLTLLAELKIGDRIRITKGNKDEYFNINNLTDLKQKPVNNLTGNGYTNLPIVIEGENKLFIVKDTAITSTTSNKIIPLTLTVKGSLGEPLVLETMFKNKIIRVASPVTLQSAQNQGLTKETLQKQLQKTGDTPFYLDRLNVEITDNLFITIAEINNLRRSLIQEIYNSLKENRVINSYQIISPSSNYQPELIVKCHTQEQAEVAKNLGIKTIYTKENFISYTSTNYDKDATNLLVANYGALANNLDKELTTDYEFNIINADSLAILQNLGVKHITLSKELTNQELKKLIQEYTTKYQHKPNCDFICYGKSTLMTLKYCPIKHIGHCPECKKHNFALKDGNYEFPLIHDGCTTYLLNGKALNLVDDLHQIVPYVERIRLDFTTETKAETQRIINEYLHKLNNLQEKSSYFRSKTETRAYFKREIL